MEFKSFKYVSLAASITLLTACGGGGGGSSSGGGNNSVSDSPRSAYSGNTQRAALSLSNRDDILSIFYGSIADDHLYTEELELSDLMFYAASQMRDARLEKVDESENCSSGRVKVEVSTNNAFEDFSYDLDYRNCVESGVTTDGALKGKFTFDNAIYYVDPSYLEITYDSFTVKSDDLDFSLVGKEVSRHSSDDSYTNSRNVLFKVSNNSQSIQRLFDDIQIEKDDYSEWEFGGIVSLSGKFLDNVIGEISLSIRDSDQHDGTVVEFTGANNSTLTVDYNNITGLVEIALDSDGDNIIDDLDTMTEFDLRNIVY